jgi:transposase-like protein
VPGRQWLRYLGYTSRADGPPLVGVTLLRFCLDARQCGEGDRSVLLVELGVVEQRHRAVLEVLDGARITDLAVLYGVSRKTVHKWLRRYAAEGLRGLADRSSSPDSCPHQMAVVVEARVVEMRGEHPGWGPRTIRTRLGREGVAPLPGRSSIHRALLRHGLIDPTLRRRRSDYKRFEPTRAMELWQMDRRDEPRRIRNLRGQIAELLRCAPAVERHERSCCPCRNRQPVPLDMDASKRAVWATACRSFGTSIVYAPIWPAPGTSSTGSHGRAGSALYGSERGFASGQLM